MSVEDWARREAEQAIPAGRDREFVGDGVPHAERIRFADGIVHAFDALLSDEACDEIAKVVWGSMVGNDRIVVRAALEAAVRAVNEGGSSE